MSRPTEHPVEDRPVEFWPTVAIRAALESGDIAVWQRIVLAIKRDPYGRTARQVEEVLDEIRHSLEPDAVDYVPGIAMIAIVGEEMVHTPGIAAQVFTALAAAGINVRLINQGASELNIIVGVAPEDYAPAVRALYRAFVG